MIPTWNAQLCNLCAGCRGICPFSAIQIHGGILRIDQDLCTECGECVLTCPNYALDSKAATVEDIEGIDVLVVGGGPAGLAAAYWAAKGGVSVLLIEKKKGLEIPLSCAEGTTVTGFADLGIPMRESWISQSIEGGILISPSGKRVFLKHPDAGFILDRRKLAKDLAVEISDLGGRILTDSDLFLLENGIYHVRNRDKKFRIKPRIVIAADGVEGSVKRLHGIKDILDNNTVHSAAQYVVAGVTVEYPTFLVGSRYSPGGYLWLFPKGKGLTNIGVGIEPNAKQTARDYLQRYMEENFPEASVLESTGGIVPARKLGPFRHENVLFAGDAAGTTDPLSGGGIAPAFFTGRLAGQLAGRFIAEGKEHYLEQYEKEVRKSMGMRHAFMLRMRRLFLKLSDDDIEYVTDFLRDSFDGKTVDHIDVPAILKNLVFNHPRILKLLTGL